MADSNITQDIDLSTAKLEDLTSGDFKIFSFSMDIGENVLRDVYIDVKDISEASRSRSRSLKKSRAVGDQVDFCEASDNFKSYISESIEKVEITKSNICSLINWDESKLYYENDAVSPSLQITFNKAVVSSINRPMTARFKAHGILSPIPAFEITKDNTKKKFIAKIKNVMDVEVKLAITTPGLKISLFTIGNVLDYFNHTHIKDSILAYKTLKQTRATKAQDNANNHWNNYINGNENGYNLDAKEPLVMSDVMTHRITDFDKILKSLNLPKFSVWSTTDYAKNTPNDDGRIPLLVIHGWQGGGGLRNPAVLGLWENSEFAYFNHFLDYYLTSKALQKKYHVYLYRYMSYKHVTYNAWQLKELLDEVKTNHPNSDLAKGLKDSEKGLTILAHSMGGLVSRALIEEYNYFGSDLSGLNKLITLDTPHHGSTSAEDYKIQNWIKDLGTHGAADLNWDNFDKSYNNKNDGKYIDNNYKDNRWNEHTCNAQEFDIHYSHIFKKWKTSGVSNPYLSYLNNNFIDTYGKYTDKYIFYTAWHTQDVKNSEENKMLELAGTLENPYIKAVDYIRKFFVEGYFAYNRDEKHDFITNGLMNASTALMGIRGHASGGAEPVGSSLLSTNLGDINPMEGELPSVSQFPRAFIPKKIDDDLPLIVYGDGTDMPINIPYRLFWDYDHEMIMAGAYQVGAFGLSGSQGVWDKYISMGDSVTANNDTSFKSVGGHRLDYINAALKIRNRDAYDKTDENLNPLKYEPVFLVLEKDLLDIAGGAELTAEAGEEKTISAGQSVTLDGSQSTGDITAYQWSDEGDSSVIYCAKSESATCVISGLSVGEHSIMLITYDALDDTALDTVKVTVTPTPQPSTSKVLKTGQTSCYDYDTNEAVVCTEAHKGQDGYYATIHNLGLDRSYSGMSDNDGNHIAVRDNATGIIWQDNESVTKPWITQVNDNAGNYSDTSGDTATTYCQNLPLSGTWRLPTIKELQTLLDFGKYDPAIDAAFVNKTSDYYWSSTTLANYTSYAWLVYFYNGDSYNRNKSNNNSVRCVRSGQ